MFTNRRTIRIQFGDCDSHGIVFYPRYFEFFDACRDALFARAGPPREKLLRTCHIDGISLVDVRISFLRPSRYGDTVAIESSFAACGRSSFSVGQKLSFTTESCWPSRALKNGLGRAHQTHSIPISKARPFGRSS